MFRPISLLYTSTMSCSHDVGIYFGHESSFESSLIVIAGGYIFHDAGARVVGV